MVSTATKTIIAAALEADGSVTPEEKTAFMNLMAGTPENSILVSAKEACKILGISKVTLWSYVKNGKLHQIHRSKRLVRYNKSEVEDLAYKGI